MEIVPFIVDLHGSHGPDARKFLRLLADFRPRPRLSGENTKARVDEEMAASCVLIARKGAMYVLLPFKDKKDGTQI